jgi:hypothetical protein
MGPTNHCEAHMLTPRRRTPGILAGFVFATLLVACADSTTGPKPAITGPRSLRDSADVQWADTLACRYGWLIVNSFVECLPPE